MLPFPKLLNTNINPVSELQRLKDEVEASTYFNLYYTSQGRPSQPYTIASTGTYMLGIAVPSGLEGAMYGTSFNSHFTRDSSYYRIYQHCFVSQNSYNYYKSNPDTPSYAIRTASEVSYPSYDSLNRNGYSSISYSSYLGYVIEKFVYYDPDTGYVMQYNPSINSTPTRYY